MNNCSSDFNWFQDQKMVEAFKKSPKAYLLKVDEAVQYAIKNAPLGELDFGRLSFTLRIHAGKPTDIVVTQIDQHVRFDLTVVRQPG